MRHTVFPCLAPGEYTLITVARNMEDMSYDSLKDVLGFSAVESPQTEGLANLPTQVAIRKRVPGGYDGTTASARVSEGLPR